MCKVRDALVKRQGNKCFYCNRTMSGHPTTTVAGISIHPLVATFDHIILAKDGGPITLDNGVAACHCCNQLRGDKHWVKWLRYVRNPSYALMVEQFTIVAIRRIEKMTILKQEEEKVPQLQAEVKALNIKIKNENQRLGREKKKINKEHNPFVVTHFVNQMFEL